MRSRVIPVLTFAFLQQQHSPDSMNTLRRFGWLIVCGTIALGAAAWAALAPISVDSHDELFEIPKGTWSRRMAGDSASSSQHFVP